MTPKPKEHSSITAQRAKAGAPVDFVTLASDLMFGKTFNVAEAGLEYRKNKTSDDVHAARRKALNPKNGHAKVEFELSMLELYLKDVFKTKHIEPVQRAPAPEQAEEASV